MGIVLFLLAALILMIGGVWLMFESLKYKKPDSPRYPVHISGLVHSGLETKRWFTPT